MNEQSRDYSRCKVLVPYRGNIEDECDLALRDLEKLGPEVIRKNGCSEIGFARSEMVSDAILNGWDSILFVDSDMMFHPLDALRLFDRPEPVIGGLYSQKGFGKLAANLPPCVEQIHCGRDGTDYPARGVGCGFLRIKVDALTFMVHALQLPCCTYHGGNPVWPIFQQFTARMGGQWAYLGEDYAFCQRCTMCAIPIIIDTSIMLYHIGKRWYGVEQAGEERPGLPDRCMLWHQAIPDLEEIMA